LRGQPWVAVALSAAESAILVADGTMSLGQGLLSVGQSAASAYIGYAAGGMTAAGNSFGTQFAGHALQSFGGAAISNLSLSDHGNFHFDTAKFLTSGIAGTAGGAIVGNSDNPLTGAAIKGAFNTAGDVAYNRYNNGNFGGWADTVRAGAITAGAGYLGSKIVGAALPGEDNWQYSRMLAESYVSYGLERGLGNMTGTHMDAETWDSLSNVNAWELVMDDMDFLPGIKNKEKTHQGTLEEELDESMNQLAEKNPITDSGDGFFDNVLDGIGFLAGKAKGIGKSIYDDVADIGKSVVTGVKHTAQRVDNYFEDGEFVTNEQLKSMDIVQKIAGKNFAKISEKLDPNMSVEEKMAVVMSEARAIYGDKQFIDEQHMLNTYASILVELEATLGVSSGDDHVKYGYTQPFQYLPVTDENGEIMKDSNGKPILELQYATTGKMDCVNTVIAGLYIIGYVNSNIHEKGGSTYYEHDVDAYGPVDGITDTGYRHSEFVFSYEAELAGAGGEYMNETIPYAVRPKTAYTGMVNMQVIPGSGGIMMGDPVDLSASGKRKNADGKYEQTYIDSNTNERYFESEVDNMGTYKKAVPYSNGVRQLLFDNQHFDLVSVNSNADKTGLIGLTQRPYGSRVTYQESATSPVKTAPGNFVGHVYGSINNDASEIVHSTTGKYGNGLQRTDNNYGSRIKTYLKPKFYNQNRQRNKNWWD